ncbi:MAG: glycosyltransferase [Terriglobia bacterium]|jgi:glycosyltransferase involved in cell wall biosynthesis
MGEYSSPTVSVVIAAYNAARWIAETLDSVLAQTFRDFEVIVVDDGSTDQTPEAVAGYKDRIRYLRKENGGQPSARNVGIHAACGSYIAFVDADDLWLPEKLQLQMELFSRRPDLAWLHCDAIAFDGDTGQELYKASDLTKLYTGDILRPLLLGNFISSPTPVIRRDVFGAVGYFDESPDSQIGEDWDMWLRIAAKCRVEFVDRPLARYRCHRVSTMESTDLKYAFRSLWTIVENAVARDPERLSDLREQALARVCIRVAGPMVRRGDRRGARQMLGRAVRLFPWDLRILLYWLAALLPTAIVDWVLSVRRLLGLYGLACR